MKINLQIERLVLDGLPVESRQRGLVRSAIETELTRLLAESGLAPELMAGVALSHFRAGPVQLTNDVTPQALGQQIAGAVHGGIGGEAMSERSAKRN